MFHPLKAMKLIFLLIFLYLQQEVFDSQKKKEKKGKKKLDRERKENEKLEAFQEELDSMPRPKILDLLPFQLVRYILVLLP